MSQRTRTPRPFGPVADDLGLGPAAECLSVLDLGAGAFHLTTVNLGPSALDGPRRADREPVRMVEPLRTGRLDDGSWGAGLGALRVLTADERPPADRIVGVASSWFAEVARGRDFLADARRRFGLSVEPLAGDEEARLLWSSARTQSPWARGPIAVLGLGASSLHLALGIGRHFISSHTLPLGALRLRARHVPPEGPLEGRHARAITDDVVATASAACKMARAFRPEVLLLTGGTMRALARAARRVPGSTTGVLGRLDALALAALLSGRGADVARAWGGARDRFDTLGPSAIVLATVFALLGVQEGIVVRGGLRDGLILRELEGGRGDLQAAEGQLA